jgi:hypothetical protein
MSVIDWAYLGAHFLRIFGLSLILAAFSYHTWLSQEMRRPLSAQFRERSWQLAVNIGLSLVAVSITVMPRNTRWWTRLTALIIALALGSIGVRGFFGRSTKGRPLPHR